MADMRLINANDIPWRLGCNDDGRTIVYARATDVDAMPTIDAVSVVRCKDCIYVTAEDGEFYCDGPIGIFGTVGFNDFCSFGERKEQ